MECTKCENPEAFNRVIINQLTGEELGVFCSDCESTSFGEILDNPHWHQQNGCAFCENPGKFKLPELDCLIESEDGTLSTLEYITLDETVALCTAHIRDILPNDKIIGESEANDDTSTHVEA